MDLNLTSEVYTSFVSYIIVMVAVSILLILYRKTKIRPMLFFAAGWFSLSLFVLGEVLSYLFLSSFIYRLHILALVPAGYFMILFIDFIKQESADKVKTAIIAAISALLVSYSFDPSSIIDFTFPNGEQSFTMVGPLRVIAPLLSLVMGVFLIYYLTLLYINSPQPVKKYSLLALAGSIILGIPGGFFILTGVTRLLPGITMVPIAVGGLLVAIAFYFKPELSFVLPFKIIRLMVVDAQGGNSVFDYYWADESNVSDDSLFAGMFHGIRLFLTETLASGNIKEIILDDLSLIVHLDPDYPFYCVLVATRSSPSLRHAISTFFTSFKEHFLTEGQNKGMIQIDRFENAVMLVEKAFPFIPEN